MTASVRRARLSREVGSGHSSRRRSRLHAASLTLRVKLSQRADSFSRNARPLAEIPSRDRPARRSQPREKPQSPAASTGAPIVVGLTERVRLNANASAAAMRHNAPAPRNA